MTVSRAAAITLALLLLAFRSSSADAAAELSRALPSPGAVVDTAPENLELFFTQDVDQAEVTLGGDALEVELGGERIVAALGTLGEGQYAVEWTVVSAVDGKETTGRFEFEVRPGEEGDSLPEVDPEARADRVDTVGNDNRTEVLLWTAVGIAAAAILALVFFYFRTSIPSFGTTRIEGGLPPPGDSPPEHSGEDDHDDH